ncbi:VPA1267 family protein [Noviherbaspirillum pedocola]|uniref:Uncharacterized protein n=1 Tax=Noviherbaspirillum pedocola TaxID=2801341 RepID=A0A934SXE9_9BURK|nr:VPA1267 family protein [Noviherbaspirillum pedocola]MBK4734627.1 hypothetical protein [Noviherbaspirillum pedocola]
MANGAQVGEENWNTFQAWMQSKSDSDFKKMVIRGVLSRTDISKECNFAKSALNQNPRIKDALKELEDRLRSDGILPATASSLETTNTDMPTTHRPSAQKAAVDAERLRRLEIDLATVRAERDELKRQLERYTSIHEALALTGRIPR